MRTTLSRWLKRLVRATQVLGPIFWILVAAGTPAVLLSGAPSLVLSIVVLGVAWQLGAMLLHSTARRLLSRNVRLPTYRLTRSGFMYGFMVFALALVAIQTGLNTAYLSLAFIAAMLLTSTIVCALSTRGLGVTRRAEGRIFAGENFPLHVTLHNPKRWLSAVGVNVSLEGHEEPDGRTQRVSKLPAGQSRDVRFPCQFERRGYHSLPGARLTSRFPLGLTEVSLPFRNWHEVLVLPRLGKVNLNALARHHERASEWTGKARQKAQTGTFRALRSYRQGDSLWRIHWRTSARRDKLYVKEYEEQTRQRVLFVLDAFIDTSDEGKEQFHLLDRAVRFTASLAGELEDRAIPFGLISRCPHYVSIPASSGKQHLYNVWETLALAEPPLERSPDSLLSALEGWGLMKGGVVLITPDSGRSFPALPKGSITIDVRSDVFDDIFTLYRNESGFRWPAV